MINKGISDSVAFELKKKKPIEFGMNATTAFNVFARAVVRERRIPFEIKAQEVARQEGKQAFEELRRQAAEKGIRDMALEEINEVIRCTREGEAE